MSDLVIRPLVAGESALFNSLTETDAGSTTGAATGAASVGRALLGQSFATLDAGGEYRPGWSWVALRDGKVVARAAWWAKPDDAAPLALDWFDFADGEADAATELLRTAPLNAEYSLLLPPDWRERPDVTAAARARAAAVEAAGLRELVERYRYEWTAADCPLPSRTGRLEYRPEPDDAAFRAVMARVMEGTLDAHDHWMIAEQGLEAALDEAIGFFDWFPSPADWRRVAYTPDGEVVGLHVPAHNPTGPCIGFIAVVPEQRGRGYAYDLLIECTHDLVDRGATKVAAATDRTNFPMARNFVKAGYPITQERIDFVPDGK